MLVAESEVVFGERESGEKTRYGGGKLMSGTLFSFFFLGLRKQRIRKIQSGRQPVNNCHVK